MVTLEKAVGQLLATLGVLLAVGHTFQSATWAQWGQSTVIMAEMLQ